MARSKKNWDFLVDSKGNYRDLTLGDKGTSGSKGQKGEVGDIASFLTFMGSVPAYNDLPFPGAGTDGHVYKVEGTPPTWWVSDGLGNYVELEGVSDVKGDKGEKGEIGDKGDQGPAGFGVQIIGNVPGGVDPNTDPGTYPCSVEGNALIDPDTSNIWVCDGNGTWINGGEIQGPKGGEGLKGEKGQKGDDPDLTLFATKAELDNYYNKGEIDAKLENYYTKGETNVILDNYYTKGETYGKGETYNRPEIDALVSDAAGSTYTFTPHLTGTNEAQLRLTNDKDSVQQNITIKAVETLGLTVQGDTLMIGDDLTRPLVYLGTITPPDDPNVLAPAALDGNFFIYDQAGTAWNGEAVEPGYWVVKDDLQGWQNILIGVSSGVTSVGVAGGILELQGTLTDPVINLDSTALENSLDLRYLRIDGTNNYVSTKLNFAPTDPTDRVNLNTNSSGGFGITLGNSYALTLTSTLIASSKTIRINNGNSLQFAGGNGTKLDILGSNWGTLSSQGNNQIQWGSDGIHMFEPLSMDGDGNTTGLQRIINMADPIADQDAATKKYVDDNAGDVLPVATPAILGGVKIGSNVNVTVDGTISVPTVKGQKGQTGATGSGEKGQKGAAGSSGSYVTRGNTGSNIRIYHSGSTYYIAGTS